MEDVARKIQHLGKRYEETLRDKERNNLAYEFLRDANVGAVACRSCPGQ